MSGAPIPLTEDGFIAPGAVIDGRYEIASVIGQGGFAVVYEGKQLKIDRRVAVKVLEARPTPRREQEFRERFVREARVAARIDHPNVVTIHDYGVIESLRQPYIVMELLEGHDLEDELRQGGPMRPTRAIPLFLGCLEALAVGHARGVVHKDLKPSNIFLKRPRQRGEMFLLLDFGIARVSQAKGERLTRTGDVLGTPQYMAPEYIEKQIATAALDVYQMGLILVELLTGRPVVDTDNPMMGLMVHCSGDLGLPSYLMKSPLGPVIERALAHDYTERFPDAAAFCDTLAEVDPATVPSVPAELAAVSGSMRTLRETSDGAAPRTGDHRPPTILEGGRAPIVVGDTGSFGGATVPMRAPTLRSGVELEDIGMVPTEAHLDAIAKPRPSTAASPPVTAPPPALPAPAIQSAEDRAHPTEPGAAVTPPNEAASSTRRGLIAAVAVVVVLAVAGLVGGGILLTNGGGSAAGGEEAVAPAVEAEESPESAEGEVDEGTSAGVAERGADPSAQGGGGASEPGGDGSGVVEAVAVELTSTPSGAKVRRGGEVVGQTPFRVVFDSREAPAVELQLARPGYQTASVEVGPGDGPSVATRLEPVAREDRRERRRRRAGTVSAGARMKAGGDKEAAGDDKKKTTSKPAIRIIH